jgi:hypothetical protein
MSAETKAIARRLLDEAFNGGNLDVVDELVSPEFVNHDAALPEPTRGSRRESEYRRLPRGLPDLRLTIEQQVGEGEFVTTRWSADRHPSGRPDGNDGDRQAGDRDRDHDRPDRRRPLVESWTNWDTLGLMQQLGVIPALATA